MPPRVRETPNSLSPRRLFIDIFTLFPVVFEGVLSVSMLEKAQRIGAVRINVWDIRDFSRSKQYKVDAPPFGGGPGMVMRPEPLFSAIEQVKSPSSWVINLSPGGIRFDQEKARELARKEHLVLVCGHYEGIDERVVSALVDEEISIGDYVLTGGEIPAMVVLDAVVRLLPGVLGDAKSLEEESFSEGLLEYPHYTRPERFRGLNVPPALLSGNHALVAQWRRRMSEEKTRRVRPDLWERRMRNGNRGLHKDSGTGADQEGSA